MLVPKDDEYWMRQALLLANKAAEVGEVPVGAVVVCGDELIAEGWNSPISTIDPTAHAEIVALRKAARAIDNYRLTDAILYVTLEPCTMCAGALIHARVKKVVYGATEPKAGVLESNGCIFDGEHLNHSIEIQAGVLADECSKVLSEFFRKRRLAKKQLKEKNV